MAEGNQAKIARKKNSTDVDRKAAQCDEDNSCQREIDFMRKLQGRGRTINDG